MTPTHLDLLAASRSVQRAAIDDDTELLHAELSRLRDDLVRHLHDEQQTLVRHRGGNVVRVGQERLLDLLDEVIHDAHADEAACSCLVHAAMIERALHRQARLESAVLDHHAPDDDPAADRS
ncbi:MAG: hypothetical protein K1X95_06115 [Acidimicrobiia bacterium]|nr:hypothetical protein [Acidimicrobiia bacterium]